MGRRSSTGSFPPKGSKRSPITKSTASSCSSRTPVSPAPDRRSPARRGQPLPAELGVDRRQVAGWTAARREVIPAEFLRELQLRRSLLGCLSGGSRSPGVLEEQPIELAV